VLGKIEAADLLVVGTPISKGSYTGLLKHLLDLVEGLGISGQGRDHSGDGQW